MNINKLTKVASGLILIVTVTSCTCTKVATLGKDEKGKIELFTTKFPEKKYSEISYIQTDGGIFHTPQQLLNGLQKKGAELKADAIINIKYDFQAWYPVVSGTAIKYNN